MKCVSKSETNVSVSGVKHPSQVFILVLSLNHKNTEQDLHLPLLPVSLVLTPLKSGLCLEKGTVTAFQLLNIVPN